MNRTTRSLGLWCSLLAPAALGCAPPADPFSTARTSAGPAQVVGGAGVTRARLEAGGLHVLAPLPGGRWLVRPGGTAADPRARSGLVATTLAPADRISVELASAWPAPIAIMVHALPDTDPDAIALRLAQLGAEVTAVGRAGDWPRVAAIVDGAAVPAIAASLGRADDVFFVERIRRAGLLNDSLVGSVQSGTQGSGMDVTPIWQLGLRGEGQILGFIDTGLDADACHFGDTALPVTNAWTADAGLGTAVDNTHRKILAYDFLYSCAEYPKAARCDDPADAADWDNHGHGTHIAGTIAGDGDGDPAVHSSRDGLAPAAKLVIQDAGYGADACADLPGLGCPLVDLYPLFAQAYAQGVRIHNNSWGDNENARPPNQSNYSARTQDVDRFMWDHPDMLIVFAAGNSGAGNADFSVGTPATAKNILSVGSTRRSPPATSDDELSPFSSRGWTGDGRIKPDLVVPGCNVSVKSNKRVDSPSCVADSGCGTSYAAPVAVAAAALVRQYYVDGLAGEPHVPSAALVKATLINSSVGLAGVDNSGGPITKIPSNEQGWGRIQLDRSLVAPDGERRLFFDDHRTPLDATAGQAFGYVLEVAAGDPLELTLAWTDYPGTPDQPPAAPAVDAPASWAAPQLVHDLDLEVEGPDGTRYLGNHFVDGASAAGGERDARNNVERVRLTAPAPGRYTVTVRATALQVPGQQFALVATGKLSATEDCQPATAGAGLELAASAAGVSVRWQDLAGQGPYIVERRDGGCGEDGFTEVGTAAATTFDDAVAPGTYGYRVRASTIAEGACLATRWACAEVTVAAPDDEPDDPDGPGDDDDGSGCGCAGGTDASLWLMPLVAALALRRRRTIRT